MDTPDLDRLTLLERAQLLHDATLRRHGEMLDRHDEQIALLRGLMERHERTMETLTGIAARLEVTLAAIKDRLDRGHNGQTP